MVEKKLTHDRNPSRERERGEGGRRRCPPPPYMCTRAWGEEKENSPSPLLYSCMRV